MDEDYRHRREKYFNTLNLIARILGLRLSEPHLLQEMLNTLEQQLELRRGAIMLRSPDGDELILESAGSSGKKNHGKVRYKIGEGVAGRVLETGLLAIIPRIAEEPAFQGRIHHRDRSDTIDLSFICVPISWADEVVGTLSADLPYSDDLTLGDCARLLEIVAAMVANMVQQRRLTQMELSSLEDENLRLRDVLGEQFRPENMIGDSQAMRGVYRRIHQVCGSKTTVLICGETGTGKELVAAAIHYKSPRAAKPFVKVNCAALSESLMESELFGHERGAFTGAFYARVGRMEEAEGGTIFLDEIGDFSLAIQVKLLRVLQEREFHRVGSNKTHHADVRIIAATNRDLENEIKADRFRKDLFYRINVFSIHVPPLRERKADILPLANFFVEKYARKNGRAIRRISTTAINMLQAYHWPGNVRELENCLEHAVLVMNDDVIHGHHLPPTLQMPNGADIPLNGSLKSSVEILEKDMLLDALKRHNGNASAAAHDLGITPRMVRYKMKRYGFDSRSYSNPKP